MALTPAKAKELLSCGLDYLRVSIYEEEKTYLVARNVSLLHSMRGDQEKPFIFVKFFTQEQAVRMCAQFTWKADQIGVEGLHSIGSDLVQFGGHALTHKACPYPFYNLVVKSNGDVVPCCVAWEKSLVIGNVKDQTLREIWKGEALARIHRLHLEGRAGELAACRNCDTPYNSPDSVDAITVDEYNRRRG
jgi:radical SAM protein with 4Fe4S-binding SPASM domain